MTSNVPEAVLIDREKCSEKHPRQTSEYFYADNPGRDESATFSALTTLNTIGYERDEFVPTKCLFTSEALTSARPERAFYISFHEDTTKAPNTGSEEKEAQSKQKMHHIGAL